MSKNIFKRKVRSLKEYDNYLKSGGGSKNIKIKPTGKLKKAKFG